MGRLETPPVLDTVLTQTNDVKMGWEKSQYHQFKLSSKETI